MPNEYYEWLNTMHIRDSYALIMLALALVIYLAALIAKRHAPAGRPGLAALLPTLHCRPFPARWALPAILLAGAALRLLALGQQSLWYDEAFSALLAQRPLVDAVAAAAHDYHPPAYFLLLWGWSRLWPLAGHPSDAWLRLPSALLGTLNIWLTYRVARQLGRPWREAITAAALMAFLPFPILYSQEARMYQMMLTGALLVLSGYLARRWWLVALAGSLMMYTHAMSAFYLAALGILTILQDHSRLKGLFFSGVAIALAYTPWFGYALTSQLQRMNFSFWVPPTTPGAMIYLWHALLFTTNNPTLVIVPGMLFSLLLLTAAAMTAVYERDWLLLGLMLLPPLLAVPPSLLLAPLITPKVFIVVVPAFYLLIAAALWTPLHSPALRGLLAVSLLALVLVALGNYYTTVQKWPNRQWATDLIADHYQPGDAVLYLPQALPFYWYLDSDIPQFFLDPDEAAPNAGFNLNSAGLTALGLPTGTAAELGRQYHRLFVVYVRSPSTTAAEEEMQVEIVQHYPMQWQQTFAEDGDFLHAAVALYQLED